MIMCDHDQRETGLSNAILLAGCGCMRIGTVSVSNLIRMQCCAAEPHRLFHPRYGCAQDHTLFSIAMDGAAQGGANDRHLIMS